ncbi:Ubiquitin carboxyl-terminal hydrolase [Phytophthora palmivora]|uniref:Ubiquitin carboxyl-terminal hydrolase n=1 Tax=Phytophthora palmivora TaxID=4796 RepID=A0A2P4YN28_9STRA|nr:Ubiquitin carboxyl-terminal hydrolase [Phytophthora palmivora]
MHVEIRRLERANVVMSAEKYCYAKAVFEPVMEHLSELASPTFCSALQKWKEIVRKGLRGSVVSYSHMSDATTSPDGSNEGDGGGEWNGSGADSDIGPTELIDTMNVMRKIEQNTLAMAEKAARLNPTITSRNDEATQNPRARSSPGDKMRCSRGNYRSGSAKSTTVHTHASGTTKCQLLRNGASPKTGELSIKPAVQLAAKQDPKSSTHTGIEILRIFSPQPRYNQRKKLKQAKLIAQGKHKKIAVITLPEKKVPALSRVLEWASTMVDPYHVSGIRERYAVIMEDDCMSSHVAHSRCEYVRAGDIDYNFVIPKKLVIKLKAVVEAEKLKCENRAVTFAPKIGCPTPPQTPVSTYNYLVLPVYLNNIHWGVIILDLAYQTGAPTVTPYYYEPMCSTAYNSTMESIYKSTVTGFLKAWHEVSMPGEPYPVVRNGRWIDGPKQPDGTSCGVLVIVQVYSMLKNNMHFTPVIVTDDEVTIMRLRIMWMIISHPWENTSRNNVAKAVTDTDVELLETIKT